MCNDLEVCNSEYDSDVITNTDSWNSDSELLKSFWKRTMQAVRGGFLVFKCWN